jgi:hypothetical protein
VWPLLCRTPPGLAIRGSTCPGRRKLAGVDCAFARVRTVCALSCADIPVVTRLVAIESTITESTVTVYAVR